MHFPSAVDPIFSGSFALKNIPPMPVDSFHVFNRNKQHLRLIFRMLQGPAMSLQ